VTDSKYKVFLTAYIPRLNCQESLEDLISATDWIDKLVWSRSMTTLACDSNLDRSPATEERAIADPNITFIEMGDIVHAVYLINAF
jgi:hypothetical protein